MKYAFGLALGVAAVSAASMAKLAVSEPMPFAHVDRSGMERVEARPQRGKRGPEFGKKSNGSKAQRKPRPDDGDGADSNSGPRIDPGDPPGCVFRNKPLELIV
jgi:hypothetical protein